MGEERRRIREEEREECTNATDTFKKRQGLPALKRKKTLNREEDIISFGIWRKGMRVENENATSCLKWFEDKLRNAQTQERILGKEW